MKSMYEANKLANMYEMPLVDVLMIAINRYGIKANIQDNRIRFKMKFDHYEELFYLAVCVNTYDSPFSLEDDGVLYLGGERIGVAIEREKDTCDSTYFRRNMTELTLNSNMRSQCKGCKFCGTYNLDPEDRNDLSTEEQLTKYCKALLKDNGLKDFSNLVRITVCTGCFKDEDSLVNHLIMVNKVFRKFGFTKRIRYIGSQLRTEDAMRRIAQNLQYFSLSLTTECFSNREKLMRKEKAELDLVESKKVLKMAKDYGFSVNFLYILGIDDLDTMIHGMEELKNYINRFPGIQILQNFRPDHEEQRNKDAIDLNFYLGARREIEKIFGTETYKPRSWENYRGLFYTSYAGSPFKTIRI